jgi:hypothetical protein
LTREFVGIAAAQPKQTAGEEVADLAEVGREARVDRSRERCACHIQPLLNEVPIRIILMMQIGFDSHLAGLIERIGNIYGGVDE